MSVNNYKNKICIIARDLEMKWYLNEIIHKGNTNKKIKLLSIMMCSEPSITVRKMILGL